MVKVITIRDDVYERLSDLKKRNLMSFSQAIDMLLKEGKASREGLFEKAGMLKESAIDRNVLRRIRSWENAGQADEIVP
ncbi:MAG: antitoxin VapB family protein [Candidatus Bilamarchaeaceae archaeon]